MSRWFSTVGGRLKRFLRSLSILVEAESSALTRDTPTLRVKDVQAAIMDAIFSSAVITKFSKTLVFGNFMLVDVSPEAMAALRPVQKIAVAEMEEHIVARVREEGWRLSSNEFRIRLVISTKLQGLKVKVAASDLDATNFRPKQPQSPARMSVKLKDIRTGKIWTLPINQESRVGRLGTGLDIEIDNPSVSRLHASLRSSLSTDGSVWGLTVSDRGSSYGTTVAGQSVPPSGSLTARRGQIIAFADTRVQVIIT